MRTWTAPAAFLQFTGRSPIGTPDQGEGVDMPQNQLAPTTISFSDADSGVLSWPVDDWAAALEPPTVLVAEDDEGIRELLVFKLKMAGYRTLATGDGRTAKALAINERP